MFCPSLFRPRPSREGRRLAQDVLYGLVSVPRDACGRGRALRLYAADAMTVVSLGRSGRFALLFSLALLVAVVDLARDVRGPCNGHLLVRLVLMGL